MMINTTNIDFAVVWTFLKLIVSILVTIGIPYIINSLIKIGRKLEKIDKMESDMKKVKSNLKLVSDSLIKTATVEFDHELIQSYSPLKLTGKGEKFIEKLGFDKIYVEHKKDFFKFIEEEKAETEYDIELAAIKSTLILFNKKYFSPIKDYFYKNPKTDKTKIMVVLGIYIRDKYLEQKNS